MKAIFRASYSIPEHRIEAGDFVVVRPGDLHPVEVVSRRDRHVLVRLMGDGHLDRMTLLSGELLHPFPPPVLPPSFRQPSGLRVLR